MVMGPVSIDEMDERLNAIEAAMNADSSLSTNRVITRSLLKHFSEHSEADLLKGVLQLVSYSEGSYQKGPGLAGKDGTHKIRVICHCKVDETNTTGQDVEALELAIIKEMKAFIRGGVSGMDLDLDSIHHSQQLAYPYGWVVFNLSAGPRTGSTS